ncbi:MAG: site-2 protease family protein [Chloroflexi bacterium]|nr:site-2 protease family protein [Chloroflexota bacterium]
MGNTINLGKLFGIQLRLHYSWFVIFALLTVALVSPNWSSGVWWIIGIITCLLFFASVVAHELAHSLVGRANGIPVTSITLFIFGGVAVMSREATRPGAEFKMAAAGPACSAVIGGVCFLVWFFNLGMPPPIVDMVWWLMFMNLALAVFNLIPGFPLDGGRLFRATLWHFTGDFRRSTRIATRVGRGVGYAFIGGGIIIAALALVGLAPFGLNWFSGVWIAFIGWFLQNAASTSYQQTELREKLRRFTSAQLMITNFPVVSPDITLGELVENYIFPSGHRFFMVANGDRFEGILTLGNIKPVSRQAWGVTQVKEVMTPLDKLRSVHPSQDALSVLEQMNESNINQVPVVSEERIIGLITRDDLIRFLRSHAELGM